MISKGYNSLDVNLDSGAVLHLSGLNPMDNWYYESFSPPVAKKGLLKLKHNEDLLKGTGINYKDNWITKFDNIKGWVYIGPKYFSVNDNCHFIEFANYSIAKINNGDLSGIWIKPEFI